MAKKTKKVPTKVVLYVEGGCIQDIYTNGSVDITIVDKDELVEAGLLSDARDALRKKAIKGCKPATNWGFIDIPQDGE